MFSVFIKSIVTFLVIYSLWDISQKILKYLFKSDVNKEMFVFIHVRNQENSIEYIVRNTIFEYLTRYGGRKIPYVVIVDKGSQDKTEEISRKLCEDFDFLYYTTFDDYLEFNKQIGK